MPLINAPSVEVKKPRPAGSASTTFNAIGLNIDAASGSELDDFQFGCDLAVARGSTRVRAPSGMASYPLNADADLKDINAADVTTAVTYAVNAGITKIRFLLGTTVKVSSAFVATAFNIPEDYTPATRPPQGDPATINGVLYSSYWNWIGRIVVQTIVDNAYNAAIAAGADPLSLFEWELCNEPGSGGNGGPGSLAPYDTLLAGQIEPAFWTMVNAIYGVVNFRGMTVIPINLEASGTTEAGREIASLTGAACAAFMALGRKFSFNRYVDDISVGQTATVFDGKTFRAAWRTKVLEQITRMRACSLIGATAQIACGEFGLDIDRIIDKAGNSIPKNAQRQAFIEEMRLVPGLTDANFFCAYGLAVADQDFSAYVTGGSTPDDGVHLDLG